MEITLFYTQGISSCRSIESYWRITDGWWQHSFANDNFVAQSRFSL